MLVQELLKKQATEYQKHAHIIKKTQTLLDHQYQMQLQGTIPKKHKPLPPTIINTDASKEKFDREFQLLLRTLRQSPPRSNYQKYHHPRIRESQVLRHPETH